MTEDQLEQRALQWFQDTGWSYVPGATLAPEGGAPERAVMGGDHANDIKAAHGAGLPCIFAAWGYGAPGMDAGADAVAQPASDSATAEITSMCDIIIFIQTH